MNQTVNFNIMTLGEALRFCNEYKPEFIRSIYSRGEDGNLRYSELVEGLQLKTIEPHELPRYGMTDKFY